jgi:glycosyltransferase involved in cell wall biosynthesis
MRALFAHDNRYLRSSDGAVYAEGQFGRSSWDRYLDAFDEIRVAARVAPVGDHDESRLNQAMGPGVSFVFLGSLGSPLGWLFGLPHVRATIRTEVSHAGAVIARLPSQLGSLAAREANRQRKPLAIEVVASAWHSYRHSGKATGWIYAPVADRQTRDGVRRAPFVLYVTRDYLQKRYPSGGVTVGVSNADIPRTPEHVLDSRLAASAGPLRDPVFGLIGSLYADYKGVDTAIRALAAVREQVPGATLRVLGQGTMGRWRSLCRRLAVTEHVAHSGLLRSGAAVMRWLDEIDVYLQPSRAEGLPRTLIEAMSRGCPAIASNIGGCQELLPGKHLNEPGDHEGLARLMLVATRDAAWRRSASRANFSTARLYSEDVLGPLRHEFWGKFARYAAAQSTGVKR